MGFRPRAARADFFTFFGRGTSPKRSGAVLACFWADFHPEPSILGPIRDVFDDFGPNRHFGRDLTRPGTSWEALGPAQGLAGRPWPSPYFFVRNADLGSDPLRIKKCLLYFRRVAEPPPKKKSVGSTSDSGNVSSGGHFHWKNVCGKLVSSNMACQILPFMMKKAPAASWIAAT